MDTAQCFLGQSVALAHDTGNTEIRYLDAAVFQHHHIVGFNIAMDNAASMSMFQCFCDLDCKVQRFFPVQGSLLCHVLLQGNAVNQLHDNEVCIFGSGDVIHLHDVGMAQARNRFAFGMETAPELLFL